MYHPLLVFDGRDGFPLAAVLRPGKLSPMPTGTGAGNPSGSRNQTDPRVFQATVSENGTTLLSGLVWLSFPLRHETYGQYMGPGGGMGMMGGGGMMGARVPETLPTPNSHQWLNNSREVLSLERLSLVQYQTDEDKFHVYRPYMMIIPQEENHIQWITQLFTAYGLSAAGLTPTIRRSQTITQAYEVAMGLEADLMPRYEWLITNAEDRNTDQVLTSILAQNGSSQV